jgi:hypothetical protein
MQDLVAYAGFRRLMREQLRQFCKPAPEKNMA